MEKYLPVTSMKFATCLGTSLAAAQGAAVQQQDVEVIIVMAPQPGLPTVTNWAEGYIDRFRNVPLVFDESNACDELVTGIASPEREVRARRTALLNQMWLEAAENDLATNASTFAILPINELLAEGGLLSKLKAKGYEVSEP